MRSEAELSQGERWREALGLYALMTLLTVGVGFAQGSLAALAGYGALISALGFIYLPTELLARRGLSPLSFGIGAGSIPRSAKGALLIALLILPPYALSYHLWQRHQGHPAHVDLRALSRWGEELRGRPMTPVQRGELRLFAERDRLTFQWALSPGESRVKLSLEGWSQAQVKARTRGIKVSPEPSSGRLIIEGGQRGTLSLSSSAMELQYELLVDERPPSSGRLKLGALLSSGAPSGSQTRDLWWLLLTFATQLLLVAVPEEVFYRGYLQGRLDQLIGADRRLFGVLWNPQSAALSSALFALAHLATIPHPARLAVFFPSLLFAWMRRAYGNTLTPAIFHALCNLFAQLLWGCYVPR